ncbi:MAG TPA: hypothetical protein VFO62_10730 [Candidatus Binatia bacterium]|nr:hypothetical protein [Candidatus Binatia bacterium]
MTRKERYGDRRRRGRCVDCGRKAEPRRARCRRHARIQTIAKEKYHAANAERIALMREHRRYSLMLSNPGIRGEEASVRYRMKVDNGMCASCPRVAENGKRYCHRCHKRRLISWRRYRRKKRREERAALRAYVPLDQVVDLTRVRILLAARSLDWFSTYEINRELGATDAHVRNTVTQMLRRLANAGALERRECVGDVGLRASGGQYEYRITMAGRTEVVDVLGGRRRPSFAGRRTRWAA